MTKGICYKGIFYMLLQRHALHVRARRKDCRESIYAFGSRLALQCRGSCRGIFPMVEGTRSKAKGYFSLPGKISGRIRRNIRTDMLRTSSYPLVKPRDYFEWECRPLKTANDPSPPVLDGKLGIHLEKMFKMCFKTCNWSHS